MHRHLSVPLSEQRRTPGDISDVPGFEGTRRPCRGKVGAFCGKFTTTTLSYQEDRKQTETAGGRISASRIWFHRVLEVEIPGPLKNLSVECDHWNYQFIGLHRTCNVSVVCNHWSFEGLVESAVETIAMGSIQPEVTVQKLEEGKAADGGPVEEDAGILTVEGVKLARTLVAPGSEKELTLIGGGVRTVRIPTGVELKVTVLAIYADVEIVKHLSQYRGQSLEQLLADDQFLYTFLTAPVDIVAQVTYLLPLSGEEYAGKSGDNTEHDLKAMNKWGEAEELALKDYRKFFKTKNCPSGSSIYFTLTRSGLEISQSFDSSTPREPEFVVKSAAFGAALVGTMLSMKGVSPQLRTRFGEKMASLLQQ